MILSAEVTSGPLERRGNPALVLPAILRELYFSRRTGLLYVEHDPDRVSFRFVNGEVVSGSARSERGRLGETMVRYGLLGRSDLDRALEVVNKEGRRLGPVLRELGVMEAPRLEQALSLHIREMLLTALHWEEAHHAFVEEELPDLAGEDLTLRSSTGELILELVRSITSMDTVREGLGDIDQVLVPVPDPPFRLERITLTPADGYVLSRLDGKSTARTIIRVTPLPKEEVERSLLGLLCTGVIEYVRAASSPPLAERDAEPAQAAGLSRSSLSEADLLRHVRADPTNTEALFALAQFYRAKSLASRARALFQKVVELEPGHEAAAAELATLPPPSAGSGGLLDRFRRQAG